jgi:hypothetical protein
LLKSGNKGDRMDGQKLAELQRHGSLSAVYHGERGLRTLRELSRRYLTITQDLTRVMNRLKALYPSWGLAGSGTQVYAPRHRAEWLSKEAGVHRRLPTTNSTGCRRYASPCARISWRRAGNIVRPPCSARFLVWAPLRAAQVVALLQTPDRFRTKRQLWAYSSLAIEKHGSEEYRYGDGQLAFPQSGDGAWSE